LKMPALVVVDGFGSFSRQITGALHGHKNVVSHAVPTGVFVMIVFHVLLLRFRLNDL
jgi:hypothetical protein